MNEFEGLMEQTVNDVKKLLKTFDDIGNLPQDEKDRLNSLSGRVVGIGDTLGFNVSINVDREDIKKLRRDMASAISAEKYAEGFMMAIKLIGMVGGL